MTQASVRSYRLDESTDSWQTSTRSYLLLLNFAAVSLFSPEALKANVKIPDNHQAFCIVQKTRSQFVRAMAICEMCDKGEEYHTCQSCNKRLCISCYNNVHFGIGAARTGKSMIYNKCMFCSSIYATNAKCDTCDKCEIILTWKSSMDYLAAVNRVSWLLEKGQFDPKQRNENYCKTNFGPHAAQVILDAVDIAKSLR